METLHEKKAGKQACTEKSIDHRFQQEIPDLERLVQSRLKLKNPADLTSAAETPMSEVLAWAIKRLIDIGGQEDSTRQLTLRTR